VEVGCVADLRIRELAPDAAGRRRVEVSWQDGASRRLAVNDIDGAHGEGDGERIRWYLEDYAEFPADPAPAIARDAEARLAHAGADLFRNGIRRDGRGRNLGTGEGPAR
jgi:hypothetical protein